LTVPGSASLRRRDNSVLAIPNQTSTNRGGLVNAKLPPEGRRSPTLLDLGIAYGEERIQDAADVAVVSVNSADRPTLVARRAALERTIEVPDGWPLLYRAQLSRLEEVASRSGDSAAQMQLSRGQATIGELSTELDVWWERHKEQVGLLAATEAALFQFGASDRGV
jgi:hypothetical protein